MAPKYSVGQTVHYALPKYDVDYDAPIACFEYRPGYGWWYKLDHHGETGWISEVDLAPVKNLMTKKWPANAHRNLRLIVNYPPDSSLGGLLKALAHHFRLMPPYCDTGEYPEAFADEFLLAVMNEYYLENRHDYRAYLQAAWGIEVKPWASYAETGYVIRIQYDPGQPVKFGLVAMVSSADVPYRWREIFRMLVEHLSAKWGNAHPDVTRFKLGWLTRIYTHGGDESEYLREWGIRVEEAYQFQGQQSVRKESE